MKGKGQLDKLPHRRNRKAGITGIYDTSGNIVVRATGLKQKTQNTPQARLDRETFAQIVEAIKKPVDKDMISAMELYKGTTLLWRDILMMIATGTLFTIRLGNGDIWYGARTLSNTIQNLLDSISNVPGTILGRTGQGWQALLPGPAGYVLTSQGPSNAPLYQPVSGGGGGGGDSGPPWQTGSFDTETNVELLGLDGEEYEYRLVMDISNISENTQLYAEVGSDPDGGTYSNTDGYCSGWGSQGWRTNGETKIQITSHNGANQKDLIDTKIIFWKSAGMAVFEGYAQWNQCGFNGQIVNAAKVLKSIRISSGSGTFSGSWKLWRSTAG